MEVYLMVRTFTKMCEDIGPNIEIEGAEYVVNRKATAKYLPLLESINNEGIGGHITTTNNLYKTFETGG